MPTAVILCGGLGLRQRSLGDDTPKPLRVLYDGRPLLLHVLDQYWAAGVRSFVLCVGYGSELIRAAILEAFAGDGAEGEAIGRHFRITTPDVSILLVDDGPDASKSSRLLSARAFLPPGRFLLGYCDVLSDLDLRDLLESHDSSRATITLTATRSRSRYGVVRVDSDGQVSSFAEKPIRPTLISGGYFVCEQTIFEEIDAVTPLEDVAIPRLVTRHLVHAHVHDGEWLALDTYKDFADAEEVMQREGSPWLARA